LTPTENTRLGTFVVSSVGGESVKAFIPPPLPPRPAVDLTSLMDVLDRATAALGRLDGTDRRQQYVATGESDPMRPTLAVQRVGSYQGYTGVTPTSQETQPPDP